LDKARFALLVLVMLTFAYVGIKKSAQDNIKKIGLNSVYYPDRYVVLPHWIRKRYRIEQRMVPRFLYCELLLAILYTVFAVVLAACVLVLRDPFHGWPMPVFLFSFIFSVVDILFSATMSRIYLRAKKDT